MLFVYLRTKRGLLKVIDVSSSVYELNKKNFEGCFLAVWEALSWL